MFLLGLLNVQFFFFLTGSLLPPIVANTSTPTLGQLSAELRDFENWYQLGQLLNVSEDALDSIEKSHDTNIGRCIEMLQCWITNSKNPTWEAVQEALRIIGESVIAAEITRKYDIRPSSARDDKSPAPSLEHLKSKLFFTGTEENLFYFCYSNEQNYTTCSSNC